MRLLLLAFVIFGIGMIFALKPKPVAAKSARDFRSPRSMGRRCRYRTTVARRCWW